MNDDPLYGSGWLVDLEKTFAVFYIANFLRFNEIFSAHFLVKSKR